MDDSRGARAPCAHEARVKELHASTADGLPPTAYQQVLRQWVLANELACSLGHALAVAELARAGPSGAEQERARAFLAEVQELLRAAKALAAGIE